MRLRSQNSNVREDKNGEGRLIQSQQQVLIKTQNSGHDIKKITAEINAIEKLHGKADIIENSISNPEACEK